ncbi:hypothetical protein BD31_I1691 [Candidatus Nitrosopumilus salaria BD31]|uniref:Poly-beta-hydroxybutyrate polymerase N-terminal domain-containing protein n=1 Tax=Candidatus Nitrosopumilus salarius BD31 TaxID=859350 RepID=I3D364_9ARCH|nr:hypothetical protein [Candidatus Nitrosopumilus salaria]EIJ66157.1 hypothetical protein BD31_I1691 [Candidatus Nitrosopumilus salaria BD31]
MSIFNHNTFQKFSSSYIDYVLNQNQLFVQYNAILADSISKTLLENNITLTNFLSNDAQSKMRKTFDQEFREKIKKDGFVNSLSKTMDSWFTLSEYFGIGRWYKKSVDQFSILNKMLEPLRDNLNRTDSESIKMDGQYHLLHYNSKKVKQDPILIVYSLINRHYILDLLPKISVVKTFYR